VILETSGIVKIGKFSLNLEYQPIQSEHIQIQEFC